MCDGVDDNFLMQNMVCGNSCDCGTMGC